MTGPADPPDGDTLTPTGAQLGAVLDAAIERVLTAGDLEAKEDAARHAREALNFLCMLAEPALSHERAVLAAQAFEGGSEIDTWTPREIEHDPAKIAVVRRVAAQMLFANPGMLVGHQQHLLALRLVDLNNGEIGPLLKILPRPGGGAPKVERGRKIGLGGAFWMRKGFDARSYTETVRLFLDLTGFAEEKSVRRLADAIPQEERPFWEALGASRAGRPVSADWTFLELIGGDKVPDPTDENIKALVGLAS